VDAQPPLTHASPHGNDDVLSQNARREFHSRGHRALPRRASTRARPARGPDATLELPRVRAGKSVSAQFAFALVSGWSMVGCPQSNKYTAGTKNCSSQVSRVSLVFLHTYPTANCGLAIVPRAQIEEEGPAAKGPASKGPNGAEHRIRATKRGLSDWTWRNIFSRQKPAFIAAPCAGSARLATPAVESPVAFADSKNVCCGILFVGIR
jgi:hypothetical protein